MLERPYITVGFTGFLLLVPLAITSTRAWMRRLGRRWVVLHRLVYAAAVAGCLHFLWLVKADLLEPLVYAAFSRSCSPRDSGRICVARSPQRETVARGHSGHIQLGGRT